MIKNQYIIVVEGFKTSLLSGLERLSTEHPRYKDTVFVVLTTNKQIKVTDKQVITEHSDFSDSDIKRIISKYYQGIVGVLCRGDKYVQYLRKIRPFLPPEVPVASSKSLEVTTNKRMMRTSFRAKYPEITPNFVKVNDAGKKTINYIVDQLTFPVIIKPASLAASVLITKCENVKSLKYNLSGTFSKIKDVYVNEGRNENPEIIVEEFLQGDFYSIDGYIMQDGSVILAPTVGYMPAESMGIDDFFLYKRWLPVNLSNSDQVSAKETVEKAVVATGIVASTVHAELVRTNDGWKVIEIGPRIGRFRDIMYKAAYGIDHGYNDLLLHLGITPSIDFAYNKPVVAYSIYPHTEGKLLKINGLDKFTDFEDCIIYSKINNHLIGTRVLHAKNGGHALAEVILTHENNNRMKQAIDWFEKEVKAEVV